MAKKRKQSDTPAEAVDLRIIGGRYRGAKLTSEPLLQTTGRTAGERVTRPMKHRVREAIFNLVGLDAAGKHAIDVFAGTGALGLEAISRGAESATLIERHVPTATVVKQNVAAMEVQDRCEVLVTSAFVWRQRDVASGTWPAREPQATRPWLVFISPPYAFFIERQEEMLTLIQTLHDAAPTGSVLVIEADDRFDFSLLPGQVKQHRSETGWDVREYHPAVVGVLRIDPTDSSS
ncbi:Ribosomal RNA small subunit methyltransferase D [Planctomycetes bacterium MalM25]|nr:Ribosomal RNA small subunit methyltransferase D [Planctomycetes bacterium MalM25]